MRARVVAVPWLDDRGWRTNNALEHIIYIYRMILRISDSWWQKRLVQPKKIDGQPLQLVHISRDYILFEKRVYLDRLGEQQIVQGEYEKSTQLYFPEIFCIW